ncbi:uncharacterized protein EV422DRAFT_346465 [Fimicolochytrium jonesii]|uniref:uncharacterized protein n=1 Tax=Fimicolochytrium jonesii TaxID=1396493 RepID=UPI0022FEA8D8|nr:uncharacterized protein EV422DRAFT_346465 [Fimicolochytrium jonesii]KAI8815724.1 hypothetical protein EV422DRAFT_346465 [Fimicolochytrium jonesii]
MWGPRATIELKRDNNSTSNRQTTIQIIERSSDQGGLPSLPSSRPGNSDSSRQGNRRGHVESSSLYLPMVPAHLQESELEQVFRPFGELESVRIIPGKYTQHSMAFVNFRDIEPARRAQQQFNGTIMFGSSEPVRVEYAQSGSRDRRQRDNTRDMPPPSTSSTQSQNGPAPYTNRTLVLGQGRTSSVTVSPARSAPQQSTADKPDPKSPAVIFKNFSQRLSGREIEDNLAKLLASKNVSHNNKQRRIALYNLTSLENCFAAVTGLSRWEADAVVRDFNGREFFGSPLEVSACTAAEAESREDKDLRPVFEKLELRELVEGAGAEKVVYRVVDERAFGKTGYAVVRVEKLPAAIGKEDVVDAFRLIGPVLYAVLDTDNPSSGHVVYVNKLHARRAVDELDGTTPLFGATFSTSGITVKLAEATSSTVRIRYEEQIPHEELTRVFSRYGKIVRQAHTPDEASSALITYENTVGAQRAVGGMDGEIIGGFRHELEVQFYIPSIEMRIAELNRDGEEDMEIEADEENEDDEEEEVLEEHVVVSVKPNLDHQRPTINIISGYQVLEVDDVGAQDMELESPATPEATNPAVYPNGGHHATTLTEEQQAAYGELLKHLKPDFAASANEYQKSVTPVPVQVEEVTEAPQAAMDVDLMTDVTEPQDPFSKLAKTGMKNKETTIRVHMLSGNPDLLSTLSVDTLALKISQRYKITDQAISDLEAKLVPGGNWLVAVCVHEYTDTAKLSQPETVEEKRQRQAKAAAAEAEHFVFMEQYFRDRGSAGMAMLDATAANVIPVCDTTRKFLKARLEGAEEERARVVQGVVEGVEERVLLLVLIPR